MTRASGYRPARCHWRSRPAPGFHGRHGSGSGTRRSCAIANSSSTAASERSNPSARGCSLMPAGAEVEAAGGLGRRVRTGIDAHERDQALGGRGRGLEDRVVGRGIAAGLVHREGRRAGVRRARSRSAAPRRSARIRRDRCGPDACGRRRARVRRGARGSEPTTAPARGRSPPCSPGCASSGTAPFATDAIRSTASLISSGEVPTLRRTNPSPPLPNIGPELSATLPRSSIGAAGSGPRS